MEPLNLFYFYKDIHKSKRVVFNKEHILKVLRCNNFSIIEKNGIVRAVKDNHKIFLEPYESY